MPKLFHIECNNCNFSLPGIGTWHVFDDNRRKIFTDHPLGICRISVNTDHSEAYKVFDIAGYISHCVCCDCFHQFRLDLDREARVCEKCGSNNVKSSDELSESICPKCSNGKMIRIESGIVT